MCAGAASKIPFSEEAIETFMKRLGVIKQENEEVTEKLKRVEKELAAA